MVATKKRVFLHDILEDAAQIERVVKDAIDGKYSLYYLSTSSNTEVLLKKSELAKIKSGYPRAAKLGSKYNTQEISYLDLRVREDHVAKLLEGLSQPKLKQLINPRSRQHYNTPWLAIMDAAIAEFFHPIRRNPDAKREEIIDWIIKQAVKTGIANASENVAQSIFTVIKPANHNPKIRRK